ncbi:hypothetical protein MUCCIDRAFT_115416 [Mucor lusitanicus CBS 277.49]|uniref:Ras GEF n=1 Tax=Mucor lusitanicus CBS 277.49 TaxID=747725 RepID=A0A168H8L7_MUCCL|nr:hypothetical protein MUCCIDRAFT_115416 [Mucor lusitanicus CBS 277.49]
MSAIETAAPRKRNNSIIPLEFRNDTSDGGMERAALATVFGVREYTESKIFWNADEEPAQDTIATTTTTTPTTTSTLQRNTSRKSYTSRRGSTIMMQTSGVLSVSPSSLKQASLPPPAPPVHRSLPKIPVVSEFGDIWSDTHFASASAASAVDSKTPTATATLPSSTANHAFQLSPPTDLSDFPLTIFDLLESDENPNLILWGIDAKQHSTVPSTAPSTADERDDSTLHNHKKKSRWSAQQLIPLKKLKKKVSVDLSNTVAVPDEPPAPLLEADRVIEAATIEKLVEKLTISLDYAFMTDFFLIYRVFMTPLQLCKLLILRFNWSLEKNEAKRCIGFIRTFVVMRHWLLNYFLRDFIPSKELRIVLTDFLNAMPYHPLIKQSPRDQRIIKGLKRVVRRLKKIYYASNASTRVQVIGPPPPTYEQQVVKQMVKDQLTSSSTIRQKTLNMVNGVHLDARHSNNTAIRHAQVAAPNVVVIGNYPSASTHNKPSSYIEQPRPRRRRGSSVSSSGTKFNHGSSLPNSLYNLHDTVNNSASMEWINIQQQQQLNNSKSQDFYISNFSDNSLESAISPGTSDDEEVSDEEEEEEAPSPASYHSKELNEPAAAAPDAPTTVSMSPPTALNSNNELTEKLEMVRQQQQQQEEEAEKLLAATYSSSNPTKVLLPNAMSDYTIRTRSFYSAQLAIPSTISTPDIYHPPTGANATNYFDSASQANHSHQNLVSSTSYNSMAYPSVTDSEVVTPGDPTHTLVIPRSRFNHYNLQQQQQPNRMSKTFVNMDPKSKPLPPLVLSQDEKESSSLTSASSIGSSSCYTTHNNTRKQENKAETWQLSTPRAPKSRIFEIDIDPNRNNEFLSSLPPSIPMPNTVSTLYRSIVLSYSTSLMAQQFCLIERAVLLDIDWEELVDCRWTKMSVATLYQPPSMEDVVVAVDQDVANTMAFDQHPQGIYSRTKRMKQQHERNKDGVERGIEKTINRFNAVCQWVSSEIVQTKQLDQRVKLIEKFIRLAKKCKLYCNFSTLIQILLGLQSSSVSRLEKTWPLVNKRELKTLQELSTFTSPTKNWKHIRDSMSQVAEEYGESPTEIQVEVDENSSSSTFRKRKSKKSVTIKLPFGGCIPFLGIYLSDLVFNAELPSYLPSSNNNIEQKHQGSIDAVLSQPLVHFRKHRITATVIKRVLVFQNLAKRYSFEESSDLLLFNTCFQVTSLDTQAIQKASYEIEPPPQHVATAAAAAVYH